MTKINSRNKGNTFERKIAKAFTDWSGGKMIFRRSPLSGGWEPRVQTGDIFPIGFQDHFPFIIEVRKNEQFSIDKALSGSCIIDKWFQEKKTMYDDYRKKHKLEYKELIFIMSRNGMKPVVVEELKSTFIRPDYHHDYNIDKPRPNTKTWIGEIRNDGRGYIIFDLDYWLGIINYEKVVAEIQRRQDDARKTSKNLC